MNVSNFQNLITSLFVISKRYVSDGRNLRSTLRNSESIESPRARFHLQSVDLCEEPRESSSIETEDLHVRSRQNSPGQDNQTQIHRMQSYQVCLKTFFE